MNQRIELLHQELKPLIDLITHNPLSNCIESVADLRIFMQHHVYAVWDFMCLIKALHHRIVSTTPPWLPPEDAHSAHLIIGILAEEEYDLGEDGSEGVSHFQTYLRAMDNIGADTQTFKKFLDHVRAGKTVEEAAMLVNAPLGPQNFVSATFSFFPQADHEVAACFVFGREAITSHMFIPLVKKLKAMHAAGGTELSTIIFYLERHIELDSNEHFPKALKMLDNMIGDDSLKYTQARDAAVKALKARMAFMASIKSAMADNKQSQPA